MGLRKLREESKEARENFNREYCKYFIIGDDLASALMFYYLDNKYPTEKIKILTERPIDLETLRYPGPTDLRGESNIKLVKQLRPELTIDSTEEPSKFYKDQKFRVFGGRSRPETIMPGEEFFIDCGYNYRIDELLPSSVEEKDKIFSANVVHLIRYIAKVKDQNSDQESWEITCKDGTIYCCQHLFMGRTPSEFLNLLDNKGDFSSKVHEFCLSGATRPGLFVSIKQDAPLSDDQGTLFLSQSLTHEWGHFIGEFYDGKLSFFSLIHEDEDSEQVSQKIRLLKRTIKRIFPNFVENDDDHIVVSNRVPVAGDVDLEYQMCSDELANMTFLGIRAPLSESFFIENSLDIKREDISYFARSLASFHQARRCF